MREWCCSRWKEDSEGHVKIILLLDLVNYVQVRKSDTANEIWDLLNEAFEHSTLPRCFFIDNCWLPNWRILIPWKIMSLLWLLLWMLQDKRILKFFWHVCMMGVDSSDITITVEATAFKLRKQVLKMPDSNYSELLLSKPKKIS